MDEVDSQRTESEEQFNLEEEEDEMSKHEIKMPTFSKQPKNIEIEHWSFVYDPSTAILLPQTCLSSTKNQDAVAAMEDAEEVTDGTNMSSNALASSF